MYFLLDINNLLRLKSSITPDNYVDYIDALCEKLTEMQEQIQELKDKIIELECEK